jgi:alcohol/geraniol dehydrogenase (NADP+)
MIEGFAAREKQGRLEAYRYEPGPLGATEVEIAVDHCGLCHSDLHLIDDAWNRSAYPLVPGHEIVGTVVARGSDVGALYPGQRVGVGWQRGACLSCDLCRAGEENLCAEQQATCLGQPGGLAERVRADARFAFVLPEELEPATAAPLLCGGVTVFAPLRRFGVGLRSRVAVVGIGGLGHLALLMLRAIGCEVTAFSTSASKRTEALAMGAQDFVSSQEPRAVLEHANRFDLVLSTVHARLDWTTYLRTLRPRGTLCLLGAPPGLLQIPASLLVTGERSIAGSDIGGPAQIREMLHFCARHRISPRIEQFPMNEADVNTAVARLRENKVRYRAVLSR